MEYLKYTILFLMTLIHLQAICQNPAIKNQNENIPAGYSPLQISKENVTASSFESKAHGGFADFPPYLTVDGDISNAKSWRAKNDGEWIMFDFTKNQAVDMVLIAFMKGEERSYKYSIQVCKDKSDKWETVRSLAESEKVQGFQNIALPASLKFRYFKIVGHGNSNPEFKDWININEVQFLYKN
jgi:hypothetical protein